MQLAKQRSTRIITNSLDSSVNPESNLPQEEADEPVGKCFSNIKPNFREHLGAPDLVGGVCNKQKNNRIQHSPDKAIGGRRDAVS